jgi:serine/threonine protein kinase
MLEAREGQSRLIRVFLCHSSEDKPAVRELCHRLRKDGFEPWLDEEELLPGQNWQEAIPKAVRASDVVVICLSRAGVSKEGYLQRELRDALSVAQEKPENSIFIIPVRLEEVDVPQSLTQWQWANLFQQGGYERLVRALSVRAAKTAIGTSVSPPSVVLPKESRDLSDERLQPSTHEVDREQLAREHIESECAVAQQQEMEAKRPTTQRINAEVDARERPEHERQDAVRQRIESQALQHYEVIRPIYKGHYSLVLKCLAKKTHELCVVKRTAADRVSFKALTAIQTLGCPNLATPRRVWEQAGYVFEELPYVGGVRLSKAVARGIGGLTGSVLLSFCDQLGETLSILHKSGIIHRDIHPDNIYLVVWRPNETDRHSSQPWKSQGFAGFLLAWVIVDATFATLASESNKSHYSHPPYTAEEQQSIGALPASDMYALGATLYYGITGREVPSFQTRKLNPKSLSCFPDGKCGSLEFSNYLERLLSLDPRERPASSHRLWPDTTAPGYTGTLWISENVLLKIDKDDAETMLLEGSDALRFYQALSNSCQPSQSEWREAEYWISQLHAGGVRA